MKKPIPKPPCVALAIALAGMPGMAPATPPGAPLSELRPQHLALGLYFDQSGQKLFEDGSFSQLNTTGALLDYGVVDFLQIGAFAGASELNVDVPPGRKPGDVVNGQTLNRFESGYDFHFGLAAKLYSPRFLFGMMRAVAFGQVGFLSAEDDPGNRKEGKLYNAGLTLQAELRQGFNLVLGGEFYALDDGEQKAARGGATAPFGFHAPSGMVELMRGIVGVEYFFKGPNRPFISVVFRPTGALEYQDGYNLQGASIAVTLGSITSFGKHDQPAEDENRLLGD